MNLVIHSGVKNETVTVKTGTLLSKALQDAGYALAMPCGGKHTCGKCRVKALGALSPPGEAETRLLDCGDEGIRLACFARIEGDAEVTLDDAFEDTRILTEGGMPDAVYDPFPSGAYGIAVDIGTTTVVVYLYDLSRRHPLDARGEMNRQGAFGGDVIARIDYSNHHSPATLPKVIVDQLTDLIMESLDQAEITPSQVARMVITGNTTMLHFLTGKNPRGIAAAPFTAESYFGYEMRAAALFPFFPAETALYLPACAGSYVGADITCAMIATSLTARKNALLVDIGTNGEMALMSGGGLLCCAAAAGPAFEGAQIEMGMTAMPGAIYKAACPDGRVSWKTIGNEAPKGLCGTGIISAASVMKDLGILDETGAILEEGSPYVVKQNGQPAFLIGDSGVILTQKDIRNIQLAKSAIAAGIDTLLHEAGLAAEDVSALYICGGFGSFIDRQEAANIGLIPPELAGRAHTAGNAAGSGAAAILMSSALRRDSERIAREAREISLSENAWFMERYIDRMMFE